MHVDPEWSDAFNALIRGEKWWVSLPRDLYEFKDEFLCDPKCSDPSDNFQGIGAWFTHMMPQIRYIYAHIHSIFFHINILLSTETEYFMGKS